MISLPSLAIAQESSPAGKQAILKIAQTKDFEITGDGTNETWKSIQWLTLTKRSGSSVNYKTQVKLQYSATGIYTLYWCEDEKITATLTEQHADLYNEDVVEIFFWTNENHPIYFEYELSPLNYELVLMVPKLNGKFLGWIPWHYQDERLTRHATKIVKQDEQVTGWYAEFFIPFTLLAPLENVPPKKGTTWRMNSYRIDYDTGITTWTWQPIQTTFHDIENFGTLLFD